MNKEDELFVAKKTAERAGYKVTAPANGDDDALLAAACRRVERAGFKIVPAGDAPVAAAKPAAPEQRSVSQDLARLAIAARTAEKAGYRVFKKPTDGAAPAAAPAKPAAAAESTPAETPKEKEFEPWLKGAAKFMTKDED